VKTPRFGGAALPRGPESSRYRNYFATPQPLPKIKNDGVRPGRNAEQLKQRLLDYRREHLPPNESALENVTPYETHLSPGGRRCPGAQIEL
jgi:hypothetical protein